MKNLTRNQPKYRVLANEFREKISQGELMPGDKLPSFAEICEQYEVAVTTVNQVYTLLEQEGLIERQQGRGTFVAQPKNVLEGTIGVVLIGIMHDDMQVRDLSDNGGYIRDMIRGIQSVIHEHKSRILLLDRPTRDDLAKVDGLLLFCHSVDIPAMCLPALLPKVLIVFPSEDLNIANVVADDYGAAKLATEHLISLGHRRISYLLASDHDPYSSERLKGYKAALEQAGIPFDETLLEYVRNKSGSYPIDREVNYFQEAGNAMQRWLDSGWKQLNSKALITANDNSAIGVMKVLANNGLNVPRDVSVVGFDGADMSEYVIPALTTIKIPLREIGIRGAQLLYEQIQKAGRGGAIEKITLPVQLIARESTTRFV